jgi:excisionase family DNA binding protein
LKNDPRNIVMTIGELSEYLKISTSSLYKLAQQGKVPGQKIGKHWRFHKEAIDQWLREGKKPGTGRNDDKN